MLSNAGAPEQGLGVSAPELALFVKVAHPAVVSTLCGSTVPFDLILDTEHGAFTDGDLEVLCELVRLAGRSTIIRVPRPDPLAVARALDRGAHGVMIPRVTGVEDARMATDGLRLAPDGGRGWDPTSATFGYGTRRDDQRHLRPRCLIQIETIGALEAAPSIASLPGVTDLFVGPADLARALGVTDGIFAPAVTEAIETLAQRIEPGSATLGLFVDGPERAQWAYELGYRYLAVGSDVGLLAHGTSGLGSFLASTLSA